MPIKTFDSLLNALSSSVTEAQRRLSERHQGQLRRLYSDESGQSLTWTFYVPSEEDDSHYRPIELPLVSLRSSRELTISELSIELNCRVENASAKDLRQLQLHPQTANETPEEKEREIEDHPLTLLVRSAREALSKYLARIQIHLLTSTSQGRVLVDNQELKRFDLDGDS
jgi:hypothetical protein